MKMAMVVYNEAVDVEVMEALGACGLKYYTKILAAYGSGKTSGIHLGTDIWPGRNNVLYIACEAEEASRLMKRIGELHHSLGREGLKAFILPLESLT
ncbi:MAG: PG0541 family transporter-associated protein [Candidatus Omnitrophota bacterium]